MLQHRIVEHYHARLPQRLLVNGLMELIVPDVVKADIGFARVHLDVQPVLQCLR